METSIIDRILSEHPFPFRKEIAKKELLKVEVKKHSKRRLLDVEEAAVMLNLKPGTLYNWVYQRKVPFVKVGRAIKFDLKDMEALIKKQNRSIKIFRLTRG
jgi:excisionase family DNA binding protein